MGEDIPANLRRLVVERAAGHCEYCLLPQSANAFGHEPDHILPIPHGGQTEANNLGLSCFRCNRHKGPNVGSFDPETGALARFFNPRSDNWQEHFHLDGAVIQPLTSEGRVTVKILRLNDENRVQERDKLISLGLYP